MNSMSSSTSTTTSSCSSSSSSSSTQHSTSSTFPDVLVLEQTTNVTTESASESSHNHPTTTDQNDGDGNESITDRLRSCSLISTTISSGDFRLENDPTVLTTSSCSSSMFATSSIHTESPVEVVQIDPSYLKDLILRTILSLSPLLESSDRQSARECRLVLKHLKSHDHKRVLDVEAMDRLNIQTKSPPPMEFSSPQQYLTHFCALLLLDTWARVSQANKEQFGLRILKNNSEDSNEDNTMAAVMMKVVAKDQSLLTLELPSHWYTVYGQINTLAGSLVTLTNKPDEDSFIEEPKPESESKPYLLLGFIEKLTQSDSRFLLQVRWSPLEIVDPLLVTCLDQVQVTLLQVQLERSLLQPVHNLATLVSGLPNFDRTFLRPEASFFKIDLEVSEDWTINGGNQVFEHPYRYNHGQRQAILACYNAVQSMATLYRTGSRDESTRVVRITGAAGTGKTHTVVGIVRSLLGSYRDVFGGTRVRLLVLAPSQSAVSAIAMRLYREFALLDEDDDHHPNSLVNEDSLLLVSPPQLWINLVRLGNSEENKMHRLSALKSPSEKETALRQADVVLGTLSECRSEPTMTSAFATTTEAEPHFTAIIVDDAAQCTEPELLQPLVYGAPNALILLGDRCQLPPSKLCSRRASALGLGRSLFERLERCFTTSNIRDMECSSSSSSFISSTNTTMTEVQLVRQHRMHPTLARFPLEHFYQDIRIETPDGVGANVGTRRLRPNLVFNIINGSDDQQEAEQQQQQHSRQSSHCSKSEALFVVKLLLEIVAEVGLPSKARVAGAQPLSMAILTFTREQKQEITTQLTCWNHGYYCGGFDGWAYTGADLASMVDIETLDRFQGQERDLVIISLAGGVKVSPSSSPLDGLHHEQEKQRMNFALTRAKSVRYVCLHEETTVGQFQSSSEGPNDHWSKWKWLIERAKIEWCYETVESSLTLDMLEDRLCKQIRI